MSMNVFRGSDLSNKSEQHLEYSSINRETSLSDLSPLERMSPIQDEIMSKDARYATSTADDLLQMYSLRLSAQ